jgi:ribonuclease VapC
MFIDSSALMAILLGEPETQDLLLKLATSRRKPITSPLVRYEVVVSLARSRSGGKAITQADIGLATERFDELLKLLGCAEVILTTAVAQSALEAAARYGKVAAHPAALNMGDCFSYAMAKANNMPLLYKGDDFAQTDAG